MDLYKQHDLAEAASLAVNNTQHNPTRQQQLAAFGLSPARLETGKKLLQEFILKQDAQTRLQDEQWALSQQINSGLQAVQEQFKEHARIAQVAFRQDAVLLHSLRIDRISSRRWEGVRQAASFYQQLQQQKVSLQAYGVTDKEVQQARSAALELLKLKEARADKKSMVEHSTQEKRQAQTALREWMIQFRAIARLAFRSQPQTLEAFGMKVRATV